MLKLKALPLVFILIFTSGCSTHKNTYRAPTQENKTITTYSTSAKIINNCILDDKAAGMVKEETTAEKGKVWIISEHFNGMVHGPTLRHVCREGQEVFSLQMDWSTKNIHTGKLIATTSSSTFSIQSSQTDPDFTLLESKKPNQITVSIDGKNVTYDEVNKKFLTHK